MCNQHCKDITFFYEYKDIPAFFAFRWAFCHVVLPEKAPCAVVSKTVLYQISLQEDPLCLNLLAHENGRFRAERFCLFSGEEMCRASLREPPFHLRMACEVAAQALGHIAALLDDSHALGHELADLAKQQGIVCAAQDDTVDEGVATKQILDALAHEIICSGTVVFLVLHQGHPHGAGFARHLDVRTELGELQLVGVAANGALRGHDAHMTALRHLAHNLHGGPYHAQNPSLGVQPGEVVLLNASQSLCRSGVASQNDQMATSLKQVTDRLERELVDDVERAGAIGGTGVVAEIEIVVLWQGPANLAQDSQSAVAGIEDANRTALHTYGFVPSRTGTGAACVASSTTGKPSFLRTMFVTSTPTTGLMYGQLLPSVLRMKP